MVGGPFPGARRAVDRAGLAGGCQVGRCEHQVDAQAVVPAEARPCGSPTIENVFSGWSNCRNRSLKPSAVIFASASRSGGLTWTEPSQAAGIVDVAILGGDVEVAEHEQARVAGEERREVAAQPLEPGQLVAVLLGTDRLAVRHVDIDDAHAATWPRSRAAADRRRRACRMTTSASGFARQDGDAVVGLLAEMHGGIAERARPRRAGNCSSGSFSSCRAKASTGWSASHCRR